MNNRSLLAGVSAGAGLAFFLDPQRGGRRRARIKDAMVHATHVTGHGISTASRDALHRTQGTAASLRHLLKRDQADDEVLVERVRAALGRVVSHPHAIDVNASNGVITLRGPILTREAPRLLATTCRVRGVQDVVDELACYDESGGVPALQGGTIRRAQRLDPLQENWAPATRIVAGGTGAALLALGLRRGAPGVVAQLVGAALVARAATNVPVRRLIGVGSGRRAVDVQKTITINAPVGEVYAFWSAYENFPRFMSRVLEVRASDRRPRQSHWKVAGPAEVPVEFDAELTQVVPNQLIAWRTLSGSIVGHGGVVRFDPDANGTRVHIRMSYNPPAGWLGHGIAAAFGADPKSSLDADLARMKTLIETGHAPHDAARRD